MNTSFIGLGQMGLPMARQLASRDLLFRVYNRTKDKARPLEEAGVTVADTVAEAVRDADLAITMLSDDHALDAVVFEPGGLLASLRPGSLHVSMSTISTDLAKRLQDAHQKAKQGFVSAPVFGRPEAAATAKLWIVAAGEHDQVTRARPVLEALGQGVFEIGREPWKANLFKLAGNFTIASVMETLGETFAVLDKAGIDKTVFLDLVGSRLFRSPIYENYGKLMLEKRFEPAGFKFRLGLKDITLALRAAEELGQPMPSATLIQSHFQTGVARGMGDLDWAALGEVIARD